MNRRSVGALLCLLGAVVLLLGAALPWYEGKLAKIIDPAWSRVLVAILAIVTIASVSLYLRDQKRYAMGILGGLGFSIASLVVVLVGVCDLARLSDKVGGPFGIMQVGFPIA